MAVQRTTLADPVGLGVGVARGQISLNDMLKEVEQLMEDTQHKLEEAVHQVGPLETFNTPLTVFTLSFLIDFFCVHTFLSYV